MVALVILVLVLLVVYLLRSPFTPVRQVSYGDVPVNIYEEKDLLFAPDWGTKSDFDIVNSRSLFKKVNTPIEQVFW